MAEAMTIDEAAAALLQAIERERVVVAKERQELDLERAAWVKASVHLAAVQQLGERIRLDVGGSEFVTSLATLRSVPNSFFAHMFSGRWEILPSKEAYFIDRDPSVFRFILNFLRGTPPPIKLLTPLELTQLRDDAEFYQLSELQSMLKVAEEGEIILIMSDRERMQPSALHPDTICVSVSSSGGNRSFGDVLDIANRDPIENRYTVVGNSWLCYHFKKDMVRLTRYEIKQDQDHYLRNWELQASEDGVKWVTLRVHVNDESITDQNKTAKWPINDGKTFYSYVRVHITGPAHKGKPNFDILHIRFWGFVQPMSPAAAAAASTAAAASASLKRALPTDTDDES